MLLYSFIIWLIVSILSWNYKKNSPIKKTIFNTIISLQRAYFSFSFSFSTNNNTQISITKNKKSLPQGSQQPLKKDTAISYSITPPITLQNTFIFKIHKCP